MPHNSFQSPEWFQALPLTERLASLRMTQEIQSDEGPNLDRATQRLQYWRSQPPFVEESAFAQRLAMDSLSETELLELLGEPITRVRDRCSAVPAWFAELVAAFSCSSPASPLPKNTG